MGSKHQVRCVKCKAWYDKRRTHNCRLPKQKGFLDASVSEEAPAPAVVNNPTIVADPIPDSTGRNCRESVRDHESIAKGLVDAAMEGGDIDPALLKVLAAGLTVEDKIAMLAAGCAGVLKNHEKLAHELDRLIPRILGTLRLLEFKVRMLEVEAGKCPRTEPVHIIITEQGALSLMATQGTLSPLLPGQSVVLVGTPFDAAGLQTTFDPSVVPAWASTDTSNFVLTPSADGTTCSVSAPAGATPGATATISVTGTNPDGSSFSGSASLAIATPAAPGAPSVVIITEQAPPA